MKFLKLFALLALISFTCSARVTSLLKRTATSSDGEGEWGKGYSCPSWVIEGKKTYQYFNFKAADFVDKKYTKLGLTFGAGKDLKEKESLLTKQGGNYFFHFRRTVAGQYGYMGSLTSGKFIKGNLNLKGDKNWTLNLPYKFWGNYISQEQVDLVGNKIAKLQKTFDDSYSRLVDSINDQYAIIQGQKKVIDGVKDGKLKDKAALEAQMKELKTKIDTQDAAAKKLSTAQSTAESDYQTKKDAYDKQMGVANSISAQIQSLNNQKETLKKSGKDQKSATAAAQKSFDSCKANIKSGFEKYQKVYMFPASNYADCQKKMTFETYKEGDKSCM